ncbi:MAG: AMP-binding protein [Actinobacteria bacterium]|nr:AMP-binding protein [Actinomycetota bacterium]
MDALHALSLDDVLGEHARSRPQQIAAVCGDVRLTWPELSDRVDRLATVLADRGVERGDRVLWLGQNCHRLLEGLLACARLEAVFGPVNWRGSSDELAWAVGHAAPRVVIWQSEEIGDTVAEARAAAGDRAGWIGHDVDDAEGYEALLATPVPAAEPAPRPTVDPASSVLLMYTAAFEGRPKAALLSHQALLHQSLAIALIQDVSPGYVYLNSGPLFHMATFMTTLATFHLSGTNVFVRRSDAEEILRLIQDERCTGAFLMPPTVKRMGELNAEGAYDLSSLRTMKMGVEGFDEHISSERSAWIRRPGGYGQTEVAGLATFGAYGGSDWASGRPSPVAQVRIVGPDGDEVPPGETGEIVVRGPIVMNGYLGDDQATAVRQRDGWHHTHDLGRREEDGTIVFVGPMTRIIKSGAENIYPAEVEAALAQHPAVREAAVIGVPDQQWGQSVKAVVVLHEGNDTSEDQLIEHCRERIASYKKPRSVVFVDALPRTSSGTVDRDALDAEHGGGGYPGAG